MIMYQSKFLIPTSKEVPKDVQVFSHGHLIRGGFVKQNAAGVYTYLPLAKRIIRKIEDVIREEVDNIGGAELTMPLMQASELWSSSGRWDSYGDELFRLSDRHDRVFAMSPTAEEVAVDSVRNYLNSYKKYPLNIYQINTKFRDERRPRFGLLRSREFIMFDGYSFHVDEDDLNLTYDAYYQGYTRILKRLGIEFRIVTADNGSMGGSRSQEFMAISDIGEDTICYEDGVELSYNIETAPICNKYIQMESTSDLQLVATPNCKTIDEVSKFLDIPTDKTIKATCFNIDGKLVVAFCSGIRVIEETKLLRALNGSEIELANTGLLEENNLVIGSIGPVNLENCTVVYDRQVQYMAECVVGANKQDTHYTGFDFQRDSSPGEIFDICQIEVGDLMRPDGKPVKLAKGIEVGHIFALGDKYTSSMNMTFLTRDQKQQTPVMGCYGIGVSRLLSSYIEQNNTDGIVKFNQTLTPFDYHLIPLDYAKDDNQALFTNQLANNLSQRGFSVLIDDRNERVGSKLIDGELIGCFNQIIIGRDYVDGLVEVKNGKEKNKISVEEL